MATRPMADVQPYNRNELEQVNRNWWIVLLTGIISVVAGFVILSINWTVSISPFSLARFFSFEEYYKRLLQHLQEYPGVGISR